MRKNNMTEKIEAAKKYVQNWKKTCARTLSEAKNDAANIYAENYDEYNAILNALKNI